MSTSAEDIARAFHETYERLAPEHGYETREASAKPWDEVPEQNRGLMVAVVGDLLAQGVISDATRVAEMRTIIAALAIYGEEANIEALIEKARALNENPDKSDGHKVEVYRDEGGFYRWRRKAANGQIVSDSAEGYTDKQYARHQATGLNEGVEVVDLTIEETHPLPERADA